MDTLFPEQAMPYVKFILDEARAFNLPPDIVAGIIEIESNWQPDAVSSVGAVGLMQVMPDLKQADGTTRPNAETLKSPEVNIHWGCKILSGLYNSLDSMDKALAAYYGAYDYTNDEISEAGWSYVRLAHRARRKYLDLSRADDLFLPWAVDTHSWKEAASVLKGIATMALERGRVMRDRIAVVSSETKSIAEYWGNI